MAGKPKKKAGKKTATRRNAAEPELVSGGNPDIAKADGNAQEMQIIGAYAAEVAAAVRLGPRLEHSIEYR